VQVARAHGVTIRFWDYAKVGLAIYRARRKSFVGHSSTSRNGLVETSSVARLVSTSAHIIEAIAISRAALLMSSRSDSPRRSSAPGLFCTISAASLVGLPVSRGIALSRAARSLSRGCSLGDVDHPRFRHRFIVVMGRPAWLRAVATVRALGPRWDAQTSRTSSADTAGNGGECCFMARCYRLLHPLLSYARRLGSEAKPLLLSLCQARLAGGSAAQTSRTEENKVSKFAQNVLEISGTSCWG
jgi:hypothetical protein